MVGRVPLCVHGAGETKTGSLSTPGAEEGWEFLVQLLEGPRPAPCSPLQGRSQEVGRPGRQGGQQYALGEGSQSQGLTPPQQSHESPRPSLTSKRVGRKKGPRQWGWVPAPGSPLYMPPASPCTYFCFPFLSRWEAWQSYPMGYCPPPIRSLTAFFLLFLPFTPFLVF